MANNSTRTLLATIIFLSWLFFASSIRMNLFQNFKNYQSMQNTDTDNENDELGGSLLDVVQPSTDNSDSSLFSNENSGGGSETSTSQQQPEPAEEQSTPDQNVDPQNANPSTSNTTTGNSTSTSNQPEKENVETMNPASEKGKQYPIINSLEFGRQEATTPIIINTHQDCNFTVSSAQHTPYPSPETLNMRYFSLIAFVIFGSGFLMIRFSLSFLKGSERGFYSKGLKILTNQMLLYFIILSISMTLYAFGCLDPIPINWQFLISALAIFGVAWVLFCLLILTFSLFIIQKWEMLEVKCKDNFSKTIK